MPDRALALRIDETIGPLQHDRLAGYAEAMQIHVGYELIYDCPQQTPMVLMVNIHHTRARDIVVPDRIVAEPFVPLTPYRDGFGNWCTRLVAPIGRLRLSASALLNDSGKPEPIALDTHQDAVNDLPDARRER